MKTLKKNLIFAILVFLPVLHLYAQAKPDSVATNKVFVFSINENIEPAMWRLTQKGFDAAKEQAADYIIIRLNTYGGMVNIADSIRTKILNSPKPVFVFIENNAASAGALISIAADRIYMKKGSRIGAASVVNQQGEIMPEKYQSYMRSTMRATAESHGKDTIVQNGDTLYKWKRDPLIAEAMVDPRVVVEGISDSTEIITFTAQEALQNGYCEGIASNVNEVLKKAGIEDYSIAEYKRTGLEKLIGLLSSPALQSIFIMIIVGGIYFELQTPGIGFPIAAAALAALLYFAPLYLEGLAENWELGIFILGIILIAVEIFAIPGFGVAGVLGILLTMAGLVLSMVDNIVFDFQFHTIEAVRILLSSFVIVSLSMLFSLILSIYLSKKLLTSTRFSQLVLSDTQQKSEGYIGVDEHLEGLKGKTGIAATVLRPSGKVEIDDEIYDAKSEVGYIEKGEKIKVIKCGTSQIYVMKIEEN